MYRPGLQKSQIYFGDLRKQEDCLIYVAKWLVFSMYENGRFFVFFSCINCTSQLAEIFNAILNILVRSIVVGEIMSTWHLFRMQYAHKWLFGFLHQACHMLF